MRIRTIYLATPLAAISLGLAACGSADDQSAGSGDSISVEEAAERAKASGVKPEPGQYRVTMEVLEVDIPGAPPQAVQMMREMMGGQSHQYCLTQEDVDKGFEEMARQSQDGDCTFERFDMDGGDLDAKMVCTQDGQGSVTMNLKGTGGATRSDMDMLMEGNMGGMGKSTIHMRATHERIGDCT
ncbi:DUF3617 domain-containing protein [Erythrobacteraceae bacterium E2-1 Yellow Sea]|nr:DUF3617 domain-containing protein [Erythrobacteraceae bacterium E2-1 Yellow Sea]